MKKRMKCLVALMLSIITVTMCAVPASATWTYPDGGTLTDYIVNTDDYNRTIYVYHRDTSGNLLKYCVYYTGTIGDYDVFGDSLYGYDIIAYESNQGLGEECKLTWAAGNGETAGYGQIGYQFYKLISKKSLTLDFTYRKHEATTFNIKHYIVNEKGQKTLYASSTESHQYGDYLNIRKKTITGYELDSDYLSSITGSFTYDIVKASENINERLYYDYHPGSHRGEMYDRKSYSESSKDYLDYCDNREINVYFYYNLKNYTVSFNANGGSGAPSAVTKYYGVNLTLPDTVPTRSGYTFKGWGTSSSSTSPSYQPGGNYTSNSGRTLYAIWESNAPTTYTVSYNANGGSGAPASQTKTHNVTLTLSSTKPTRSGYTFLGWSTSSTATSATYSAGGSYTANSSATLYAVWQKNATTYTVSYNANGGSGAPSAQTKTHGVALSLSSTKPTRSGYTFLGWSTSSTATSATYSAGGSYTANASATLYAVWSYNTPTPTPTTTYTVSYNANGGSGAPASQTKTKDVTLTLSSATPYRSGYTFLGWSTSSTATYPSYYAGGSYTTNASATMYAVWSRDLSYYTVSYNANGGSGAPASQTKTEDVTLILSSTTPYRSGYTFLGWSTSSSASYPTYYAGGSYTTNASVTLYAVWEQNAPETYTVRYNANGGSGAPSSQTKTEDVALTLSYVTPTRSGYDFLGWSTSSTATSATYDPGDTYTANASVTLYAVWDETNYDFSISNLTVSNSEPYKYDQITVKVRTDSWDQVNAYSDIPVQLYYDGRLVSTQYVDFSVYGVANITFTLNVGSSVGNKTIEARINWADHNNETRTGNNTVSTTINVQDYDYEVTADPVSSAGYYCEGMEVISSFYVANNSDYDIIPSMHNTARFTAYYYNGSQKVVISTQDWDDVVIPAAGTNLVYFKWTVPTGLNGKTVYLDCTVNADRHMNETNYDNNTASFSTTISTVANSQTPNTRFESEAPSSYQNVSAPAVSTDKATWTMWEYENGSFVLKRYGVQISSVSPVVAPSADCVTAVYENGKWTMRSGYGITMSYAPTISTVSGYERPDSNAYTSVQYVVATFPEFRYYDTDGNCRTLQYVNGSYQFVQNPDADGNARVHFIPVYVRDGNYTVSVTATHVWTPAGMIEATRNANVIIIDGTIYDDWYQG